MLSYVSKLVPRAALKASIRPTTRVAAKSGQNRSFIRAYTQKFTKTHEWVKVNSGVGTVGITQHAADALGEVVYVDLPKVGAKFKAGSAFGAVESVKAASDIYTPVSGEIVEINNTLKDSPDTINKEPVGEGWMIKIKMDNPSETDSLMDSAAYEKHASDDSH